MESLSVQHLRFAKSPAPWAKMGRAERAHYVAALQRRIAAARHVIRTAGRYRHSARKDARQMLAHAEARLREIGART
jgi:hypothetical protein